MTIIKQKREEIKFSWQRISIFFFNLTLWSERDNEQIATGCKWSIHTSLHCKIYRMEKEVRYVDWLVIFSR